MKLTFLGAAKTVTGSCYLVEHESTKILIDCGMFQGMDVEYLNHENFKFNAKEINYVILTHAHIDHSGLLPKLVKYGFRGKIYLTPPSSALSNLLLLDAAKIQELNERSTRVYSEAMPLAIKSGLYNTDDALNTMVKFYSVPFAERFKIKEGLEFTFIPAGHILGAASVFLEFAGKKLLFSGDIGRENQSLVKGYYSFSVEQYRPDYVIMESLYGGERHVPREQTAQEFLDIINDTLQRNGNVIVPSFAVQRTQELLEIFNIALLKNELKDNVQIYLDSPLAIAVTKLYTSSSEFLNDDFIMNYSNIEHRFQFDQLHFITHYRRSLKLANKLGVIIIAGSGMADGGRIVSHLRNNLGNGINSVIFVGYQAEGTLGRTLVDGAKKVVIREKSVAVKAEIHYLRGFSAHADDPTLRVWLKRFDLADLQKIFLVHADPERSAILKSELEQDKYNVEVPMLYQSFDL